MMPGKIKGDRRVAVRRLATIVSPTLALLLGVGAMPPSASAAQAPAALQSAAVLSAAPVATAVSGFITTRASVRVGGQLSDTVQVSPKGVRSVYVQYRRAGTGAFSNAYMATTSPQGFLTVYLMPRSTGTWEFRLVVAATPQAKAVVSLSRTVKASGTATASKILGFVSTPTTVPAGRIMKDNVSVSPRAARTMEVQVRKAVTGSWAKSSGGRSTAAGNYLVVYTPKAGVWQYRVVVRASSIARGVISATRTVTVPSSGDTTPPGQVSNLTGVAGETSIRLDWTNPSDADFAGVTIRRAEGVQGTATPPATPSSGTSVPASATPSILDAGLTPDTKYAYALFAYDSAGHHAPAVNWVGETTITTPPDVPPAPVTALKATGISATSLKLTWVNPTDADFTGVTVRRIDGSTAPATILEGTEVTTDSATSATVTGLIVGQAYSFAVFAKDQGGQNTIAPLEAVYASDETAPGPVTLLTAQAGAGDGSAISLKWTNPTDADFSGVMIRRAEGPTAPATPTDGVQVIDFVDDVSYVVDGGVVAGTEYSYAVFAYDTATPRNYAAAANVTRTTNGTKAVLPVTNVTATMLSATSAELKWVNPTDAGFTGVTVRRALGSVAPLLVTDGSAVSTTGTATSTTDSGLTAATVYSYSVFAQYDTTYAAAAKLILSAPTAAMSVAVDGVASTTTTVDGFFDFDASLSSAVAGKDLSGSLDFGDATDATDQEFTGDPMNWLAGHAYSTVGTKTVTLTVTDSAGITVTTSVDVTVTAAVPPAQPTASIALLGAGPVTVGQEATFTLTAGTPAGSALTSWTVSGTLADPLGDETTGWDGGNGAPPATLKHTFTKAGTYTVHFDVNNDAGLTAQSVTVTVVG